MPPRRSRVSTIGSGVPRSARPTGASIPAGPPPTISTRSLGICILPGEKLLLAALELLEIALELRPARLVVDAHLLEELTVVGVVPVELADAVGMGAPRQRLDLR